MQQSAGEPNVGVTGDKPRSAHQVQRVGSRRTIIRAGLGVPGNDNGRGMENGIMKIRIATLALGLALTSASIQAADVSQDAIDACIDRVRGQVGGGGGTVTYTEFSEANSMVMLKDGSGGEWRCIVSNDGRSASIERTGGAAEPSTTTEVVQFGAGRSGTDVAGNLTPGSSKRYVLRAAKGQTLYVEFWNTGPSIEYQVFHPDGSLLQGQKPYSQPLTAELFLSGDHVIEVINRGNYDAGYNMSLTVN